MKISIETMQTISKIKNSLYDDFKVAFLYHSNKLEGSTFSIENLEALLGENIIEGRHSKDDVIETINSTKLFDTVIDELGEPLDKFMLFEWHRILKQGSADDEIGLIGKWKMIDNRILNVDLKLTPPHLVDSYIFNLLEDWKESDHTIEDIAQFHARFEQIHPFQDGNGRIGRFIILKQCIESNLDIILIDKEYINEYKEALYNTQKTGDTTYLTNVFRKCIKRGNDLLEKYGDTIDTLEKELVRPKKKAMKL